MIISFRPSGYLGGGKNPEKKSSLTILKFLQEEEGFLWRIFNHTLHLASSWHPFVRWILPLEWLGRIGWERLSPASHIEENTSTFAYITTPSFWKHLPIQEQQGMLFFLPHKSPPHHWHGHRARGGFFRTYPWTSEPSEAFLLPSPPSAISLVHFLMLPLRLPLPPSLSLEVHLLLLSPHQPCEVD